VEELLKGDKLAYEYLLDVIADEVALGGDSEPRGTGAPSVRARFALESLAVIIPFWFVIWASVSWARVELSFRPERFGSFIYLWPDLFVLVVGLPLWGYAVVVDPRACAARRDDRIRLLVAPTLNLLLLYLGYSIAVFLCVDAHRIVSPQGFFATHGYSMAVGWPLVATAFYARFLPSNTSPPPLYSGYRMLSEDEAAAESRSECIRHIGSCLKESS